MKNFLKLFSICALCAAALTGCSSSQDVTETEAEAETVQASETPEEITLVSFSNDLVEVSDMSYTKKNGRVVVVAQAENVSGQMLQAIELVFDIKDEDGNVLMSKTATYASKIEDGQAFSVKATISDAKVLGSTAEIELANLSAEVVE